MAGPFVKIDDQCRTAMRNVWAIGDLVGEPMLAHKALAQGAMVAEIIAGHRRHFDPASVAAICFTEPEIVVAGICPTRRKRRARTSPSGLSVVGQRPRHDPRSRRGWRVCPHRRAQGRSARPRHPGGRPSGRRTGRRVRPCAGDGRGARRYCGTIHVHPTLGEALGEAALLGLGHALHL